MAKFCGNCGAQADDNEKFCASCGAPFEDTQQNVQNVNAVPAQDSTGDTYGSFTQASGFDQNAAPANDFSSFNNTGGAAAKKGSKNMLPVIIVAAALVVLIAVFIVIALLTRNVKIDAQKLVDVDFVGPDGYGKCYVQLDVDPEFAYDEYKVDYTDYSIRYAGEDSDDVKYSDYFSKKSSKLEEAYGKDKSDAEDMRDAILKTTKASDGRIFEIECSASKEKGLKNGDKVKITVDYDEDYLKENHVKLTNTTFEVEVKGLAKSETIDPFDGLTVAFEGVDGRGTAEITGEQNAFCYYSFDTNTYNLSNGDTVTVNASLDYYDYQYLDEKKPEEGLWFTEDGKVYVWPYEDYSTTKDYTVEGLTELQEIDPFEGMTFTTSGATPFLRVDYANFAEDKTELIDNAYAEIDGSYGDRYDVGDTFTVKVYAYSALADDGYKLAGTPDEDGYVTKEFTVDETFPAYANVSNAAQANTDLDDEFEAKVTDFKQRNQGTSYLSNVDLDSSIKSFSSFDVVDSYISFNVAEDYDDIGWSEYVNKISRLYEVKVKLKEGSKTFYAVFYVENINNNTDDGTFGTGNSIDYKTFEKKSEAIEFIETAEGYTVTKIGAAAAAPDDSSSTADSSAADSSTADSSASDSSASDSSATDTSATDTSAADDTSSEMVP